MLVDSGAVTQLKLRRTKKKATTQHVLRTMLIKCRSTAYLSVFMLLLSPFTAFAMAAFCVPFAALGFLGDAFIFLGSALRAGSSPCGSGICRRDEFAEAPEEGRPAPCWVLWICWSIL